ncbi:MAG: hypothetical protein DRQ89_14235 [Epsilonproteobacteria bacterium]|nr:MAG: hypothetical protein DRQ89_14235 [Campylobacterota bacterium]
MPSTIIGLGCTAQVGKDTAADYLEAKYPGRVKRVAFADKLKQVCMLLFGLSHDQCYGPVSIKEKVDPRFGLTPREIMQGVGQKMREIYPNIWVDTVFFSTIPESESEGFDCFIISDVRYPNEGDKIHVESGSLVKIIRDAGGVTVGADHSSETAMRDYENFDFVIENNGSLDEYFKRVDQLVEATGYDRAQGENNN